MSDIKDAIRSFILREFLPGEHADDLTDDLELMTSGIVDSISLLRLVSFLEEHFGITLAPHELGREYLNRLTSMEALVATKLLHRHESSTPSAP